MVFSRVERLRVAGVSEARWPITAALLSGTIMAAALPAGRAECEVSPQPKASEVFSAFPSAIDSQEPRVPNEMSRPPSDTEPPLAATSFTPITEEHAAACLARAWLGVTGDPPSPKTLAIVWAHWAHETGRGRHMRGYNFGGLKGVGPDGGAFTAWTRETHGSHEVFALRTFRAYSSAGHGARDYVRLLTNGYPAALRAARAGDARGFADALAAGGYFTDLRENYRRALTSLTEECLSRSLVYPAIEALLS